MTKTTHYSTLGVHRSSSYAEIKASYLAQIRQVHPDRNSSLTATRRSAELGEAWATLRDARMRSQYDLSIDMEGPQCTTCGGRGCKAAGLTGRARACTACGGCGRT